MSGSAAHHPGVGRNRLRHRLGLREERQPIKGDHAGATSTYPRARAMRTAASNERAASAAAGPQTMGAGMLPPLSVIAWNRLGFGPGANDLADFDALGADDDARLTEFLNRQLDPSSIDDSAAEARIAASSYTTLGKTLPQLWADHVVADPVWNVRIRPAVETTFATFLRATYSRRQLYEVMVGFWHNHFSVYGWEFYEAPTWVHYDRDVIRANALGNFRTLLGAVAKSTPMLLYLDNWLNSDDGPNENYARELIELHTLGDENYFGAVPRNQVPVDAGGQQTGFVDEDVFAVTRALTGWSLEANPWWNLRTGNGGYYYRDSWHDSDSKNVLGTILPANQLPEKDGEDVLDILASHPGTATFVCRKLCRRLIGDFPPQSVVDAAAQTYLTNLAAPDQIAQVVRTIALSPEFRAAWGQKIKRPFGTVVSALRAAGADFPFIEGDSDSETFDWRFYNTGNYPFGWHPPNGYPDFGEAWVSTGPRVMTWRLTNWLVDVEDDADNYRLDALAATPAGVRSANALADFWIDRILGRTIGAGDRAEIVAFMAQGHNPDFDLPVDTDQNTRERLQSMLGLIFMSPEFQWR